MAISDRLIEARNDLGWSKADLRRAAKLKSPSTITEIENGKRTESPQLPVIAEALGVEVIWLQHGRGPKHRGSQSDGDRDKEKPMSDVAMQSAVLINTLDLKDQVEMLHFLKVDISRRAHKKSATGKINKPAKLEVKKSG